MNNERIKKIGIVFFIICLSIIPCYALFTNKYFITTGHDNVFHFSQIQDLFISIKNGNIFSPISPSLNHGIGVGTRLMYGSFSHYLVALLGLIVVPLGGDLMLAYKIVIFLAYLFSNYIMYRLSYYIFKERGLSLLSVTIFALFPYRFANVYIRNALAETIVISLTPILFFSLIKWLKEKYNLTSYVLFTISMVLIIHTHNISALFLFIFVLIFLGVNYKKLLNDLKTDKRHLISFVSTIVICISLCAPFIISILEQASLGIYRVFNKEIMGTNYNAIVSSYNSVLSYFIYSFQDEWRKYLLISIPCFLIPIILYYLFNNTKYKNKIFTISYTVSGVIGTLILNSLYVLIAFILSFIFMIFILCDKTKYKKDNQLNKTLTIISLIIFALLFIYPIWYILPSILHNIQFIWRMWGFLCVVIALLLTHIISRLIKTRRSYFSYYLSMGLGILIIASYPVGINDTYFDSSNTINGEISNHPNATGWQLEYFPEVFFDNNYKSDSKLFNDIKNNISSSENISYTPYIYDGKGKISNYVNTIPNVSFEIEVEGTTIVQLPLIYYKGYKITLITDNETKTIENYQMDGLLSFTTNESGKINIRYERTTLYKVVSYNQLIVLLILSGLSIYYVSKRQIEKKQKKLYNNNIERSE